RHFLSPHIYTIMTTIALQINGVITAPGFDGSGSGITGIPRSSLAAGVSNQVVINDGNGNLSSEALLAVQRGGTGVNLGAVTGPNILTVAGGALATTLTFGTGTTPNVVA